ncbi:MAG TPA: hypothetical protein VFP70_09175 [Burkholderiales bacterium]|nr:hypothetical protein [Burkholderiales bacterium]
MNKANRHIILAATLSGLLVAGGVLAATSRAEEAGATAGRAVACGARAPELREFIRQSMVTIEADSRNADELQRHMSGFAEAFARGAFPRVPTATCATLPQDFQRVYRGMGGAQTLVVTAR